MIKSNMVGMLENGPHIILCTPCSIPIYSKSAIALMSPAA